MKIDMCTAPLIMPIQTTAGYCLGRHFCNYFTWIVVHVLKNGVDYRACVLHAQE